MAYPETYPKLVIRAGEGDSLRMCVSVCMDWGGEGDVNSVCRISLQSFHSTRIFLSLANLDIHSTVIFCTARLLSVQNGRRQKSCLRIHNNMATL